jgi:TPR repeat protein
MNRTFKAAVAALILAAGFACPVTAAPFEDAGTAYMKRDYAKATGLLRPLAEQGNADAQAHLTLIDVAAPRPGGRPRSKPAPTTARA